MSTYTSNTVRPTYNRLIILCRKLIRYIVVKNPLSPIEHPGGIGVNNELFEESLEQFVVSFYSGNTRQQAGIRIFELILIQTRVLS